MYMDIFKKKKKRDKITTKIGWVRWCEGRRRVGTVLCGGQNTRAKGLGLPVRKEAGFAGAKGG